MQSFKENKDFIISFYNLLMELNLNRSDLEILEQLRTTPDAEVEKSLLIVRQMKLKAKAQIKRSQLSNAQQMIEELKQKTGGKWNEFLISLTAQPQYQQLGSFFRKYEQVNEEDKLSMLNDRHLLELLKIAKEKLEATDNPDLND